MNPCYMYDYVYIVHAFVIILNESLVIICTTCHPRYDVLQSLH